jgi:hypothetical protein
MLPLGRVTGNHIAGTKILIQCIKVSKDTHRASSNMKTVQSSLKVRHLYSKEQRNTYITAQTAIHYAHDRPNIQHREVAHGNDPFSESCILTYHEIAFCPNFAPELP